MQNTVTDPSKLLFSAVKKEIEKHDQKTKIINEIFEGLQSHFQNIYEYEYEGVEKMNNLQFFDFVFSDYFKYVFEKNQAEKDKLKKLADDTERCQLEITPIHDDTDIPF